MVDYQSLYRRYRPQRFAEVRGQDHIVKALGHAVRDNRVAHVYLFSGPRGTGKTSTARILAKALNCVSPLDGEPCGVCDSCLDITRGASFDVHELDAASNNGVDAMRDLVARASLATPGRWKVYIVDEVHMLSQSASNALLKTLEEPPDHVVFVLATTDPQKVLPTIRSRTQHYEFHLLDSDVLALLLTDIVRDAQLELPDSAVESAVRRGRGSARDAISALDQVVASGVVDDDTALLHELVVALAERDTARALQVVQRALVWAVMRRGSLPSSSRSCEASSSMLWRPVCHGRASYRRCRGHRPPRRHGRAVGRVSCSGPLGASAPWRCWERHLWRCGTRSTAGSRSRSPSFDSPTQRPTTTRAPCSRGSNGSNAGSRTWCCRSALFHLHRLRHLLQPHQPRGQLWQTLKPRQPREPLPGAHAEIGSQPALGAFSASIAPPGVAPASLSRRPLSRCGRTGLFSAACRLVAITEPGWRHLCFPGASDARGCHG